MAYSKEAPDQWIAPVRNELEVELRRLFDAGDLDRVATRAVKDYRPEIFGLLVTLEDKMSYRGASQPTVFGV